MKTFQAIVLRLLSLQEGAADLHNKTQYKLCSGLNPATNKAAFWRVGIESLASSFFCNPFFHMSLSQYRSCLHLQKTSLYHCPIIHDIAPHFCSKNCMKLLEKHIPLKPMRALGELKGVCST
jgi:hypothetical protein